MLVLNAGNTLHVPCGALLAIVASLHLLLRVVWKKGRASFTECFEKKYLVIYCALVFIHYCVSIDLPELHLESKFRGLILIALPIVPVFLSFIASKLEMGSVGRYVYPTFMTGFLFCLVASVPTSHLLPFLVLATFPGYLLSIRIYKDFSLEWPNLKLFSSYFCGFFAGTLAGVVTSSLFILVFLSCIRLYRSTSGKPDIDYVMSSEKGDFIIASDRNMFSETHHVYFASGLRRKIEHIDYQRPRWWNLEKPLAEYWNVRAEGENGHFNVSGLNGEHLSFAGPQCFEVIGWLAQQNGFIAQQGKRDGTFKYHYYDFRNKQWRCILDEKVRHRFYHQFSGNKERVYFLECGCGDKLKKGLFAFKTKFAAASVVHTFELQTKQSIGLYGPGAGTAIIVRKKKHRGLIGLFLFKDGVWRDLVEFDLVSPLMSSNGRSFALVKSPSPGIRQLSIGKWSDTEEKYLVKRSLHIRCEEPFEERYASHWSPDGKRFCLEIQGGYVVFNSDGRYIRARRPKGELNVHGFFGNRWLIVEQRHEQVHLIDLYGTKDAVLTYDGIVPPLCPSKTLKNKRSWLVGSSS